MNAASFWMDQFRKNIHISRFEFAQVAVPEDLKREVMLKRELVNTSTSVE